MANLNKNFYQFWSHKNTVSWIDCDEERRFKDVGVALTFIKVRGRWKYEIKINKNNKTKEM